ncbi:MAG: sister chromatid cohesion protein PDS5 [Coriobacteriales bacterium]
MTDSELYKDLGQLTRDRGRWEESIPYVSSLLSHESAKIQAKALWLLGEMGLAHPRSIRGAIPAIAACVDSPDPLLRERAANALGRIGRADFPAIEPYWPGLFRLAADVEARVRLAFIWASENIATNTPGIYEGHMPVIERLLRDEDDKVRMEAPEIFRVLGKRRPEFVAPYLNQLRRIAETDGNRVVRIHCLGAVKATEQARGW